jgi:hypothetical protein
MQKNSKFYDLNISIGRQLAGKFIPKEGVVRYSYGLQGKKSEHYEVLVSEGLTVNLSNFVYNLTVNFVKNLSVEHIGKI